MSKNVTVVLDFRLDDGLSPEEVRAIRDAMVDSFREQAEIELTSLQSPIVDCTVTGTLN